MNTVALPLASYRTAVTDAVVLVTVYFIPALSHLTPFPLYLLEPMRLLLFAGLIIARNNINTYFLALTIPLVSTIVSAHPPFPKAIIMSMELYANVAILIWISQRFKWNDGIAFFISTLISKVIYYALKFVFLKLTWIQGGLISTPISTQLMTLTILSLIYGLVLWPIKRQQ